MTRIPVKTAAPFDRVTESLNKANQRGNTKKVYRLVKLLGVRHEVTKLRGFQATVANPEQEREEWKEHFPRGRTLDFFRSDA